jgi:flagellin
VNRSADDAAGLSIRELMRAQITALNQGIRNANDAISLIQTADGALGIIDEKLIRMKELAEQAATGTYNSDQRLIIDQEFQAMGAEINRIARATDFNGVKLLDGSLSGPHDGSGLAPSGGLKVHFGPGNDPAEDYYYITIGDATTLGLGLIEENSEEGDNGGGGNGEEFGDVAVLGDILSNGGPMQEFTSGIISFAIIPVGTKNVSIEINDKGINDSIQIFTRSGTHLAGTTPYGISSTWPALDWINGGATYIYEINSNVLTEANAFLPGAVYSSSFLNGIGNNPSYTSGTAGNVFTYQGMSIGYSGDGQHGESVDLYGELSEYLTVDEVKTDLVLLVVGDGAFNIKASWDYMPATGGTGLDSGNTELASTVSISTQQLAQQTLGKLDAAITRKDQIRAHLGATQNRLENTVSNLQIQAENLQAAESRISDVDVASEMTEFVRQRILSEAAVAMLAQANSLSEMALSLIKGV